MKEKIKSVEFKPEPKVSIRVLESGLTDREIKSRKKYPFMLNVDVNVIIETTERFFIITIPRGYFWNGADIPKCLFWIGQSKDNNYLVASMVHDYLLEKKDYIYRYIVGTDITPAEYRRLTSLIFRQILKDQKTNVIKANVMAWAVDIFQATAGAKTWKELG